MANKKWAEPNVADPLSEPAFNRRMWAAYLAAGFTRAQFARALDARDALVWEYDATPDGRYQPLTPTFVRAFIRTYLAARDDDGLSHALALSRAIGEATNARAHAKAFEERRRPDGAAAAPSPKRKRKGALRIPVGKPTAR